MFKFKTQNTPKTSNGISTILLCFDCSWNYKACIIHNEYRTILYFYATTICGTRIMLAVMLSRCVSLYIGPSVVISEHVAQKSEKTHFFFQRENPSIPSSEVKILNQKRISGWKRVCSVCSGVQQVFRTGVNTSLKKYHIIFNGLQTANPRCSGVYAVLAIEHQDRLHRQQQPPSYTAKKSGLSDFQYIGKHLNTYMSCIAKSWLFGTFYCQTGVYPPHEHL
jgi:hypothetical protein